MRAQAQMVCSGASPATAGFLPVWVCNVRVNFTEIGYDRKAPYDKCPSSLGSLVDHSKSCEALSLRNLINPHR